MKKKVIIPVLIACIAALAVSAGCIVYNLREDREENTTAVQADLDALVKNGADTAFDFFENSNKELPDNMRGCFIDPETDIDMSGASADALKTAAESVLDNVHAINPNTVAVSISPDADYESDGFDCVVYLCEKAKEKGMFVILNLGDYYSADRIDGEKLYETASKYGADAVMTDADNLSEKNLQRISEERAYLRERGIFLGLSLPGESGKASVSGGEADFYFITIDSSTGTGAENLIASWSQTALSCESKLYAVLRNDLVMSGEGWTVQNEIYEQTRLIYNYCGFSGSLMKSYEKLASDDNRTATNLYSYYEYFNDSEYTALTLTDFSLKDNTSAVFSGTSDSAYPVCYWCTAANRWCKAENSGEDGSFTAAMELAEGENKLIIRHKNAMYIYKMTRVTDVLGDCSAEIADGKVYLKAYAAEGAAVYASLANTVSVELEASENGENGMRLYTAEYDLEDSMALLKREQVSFGAYLNGMRDCVMCGEEKKISPYDDNGLGTALMCVVENGYSSVTPASASDDNSDPLCTPQLSGAYGYVDGFGVYKNHLCYKTSAGVKIHSDDASLLIGGYILPENNVTLKSVGTDGETTVTLSQTYPTFTKITLEPQEYYVGYLERNYNVKEFTAEYVDITFFDTAVCTAAADIDFSGSEVIEKEEWYADKENSSVTLRLYLKEKGSFTGYSLSPDGTAVTLEFKNNPKTLSGSVIMLDPGHGGFGSPGAGSSSSVYEKDITLSIAQKAAQLLRKHGAEVVLTREGDGSLFLGERVSLARNVKPDVFVSIHCDGSDNTSWLGTHTFYYKSYSMTLASSVHSQLVTAYRSYYYTDPSSDAYKTLDKGIKFFPYQVTRVEECPSVLVECGYLSNEADAAFLSDENGQLILATAIAQGIVDYIERY